MIKHFRQFQALCLGLIFFLAPSLSADTDASASAPVLIPYEAAIQLALGENLDLQAIRLQSEAADIRARQAMAPNNPSLALNFNDSPNFNPFANNRGSTAVELSMTLGFPGKAWSQSDAIRHQAKSLSYQAKAKEIDILASLSNTFAALTVNDKLYRFLSSQKDKADQLIRVLEKKYITAQAAQADLLNAKVVSANFTRDLVGNRNDRQVLLTQFLNLIKRPDSADVQPAVSDDIILRELSFSEPDLSKLMLSNRPLLKAAEEQTRSTESSVTNAALQALPDFNLSVTQNRFFVPGASPLGNYNQQDYSFGISVAIPIFFPFNELQTLHAAQRDRDVAEAQSHSQRMGSVADLQSIYVHLQSVTRQLDAIVNLVLPAAKGSYELTLLNYSLGRGDYFMLNQSRDIWIEAEKSLLSSKLDAVQTFNQLIQQVGCDFSAKEGPYVCH